MTLRGIQLSATESNWRLFSVRKADRHFKTYEERVFSRDQYTCQYCGFKSKQYMDVINADGNYRHNQVDNLVTACHFCSQCFFLDGIGKSDFGGGMLIYLPEMTQGELNAMCHVLFSMMVSGGRSSADAKTVYRNLRLRSQYVEKELGPGLSNPSTYGQLLIDSTINNKAETHQLLMNNLRVLPTMTQYTNQIEAWTLEALKEMVQN